MSRYRREVRKRISIAMDYTTHRLDAFKSCIDYNIESWNGCMGWINVQLESDISDVINHATWDVKRKIGTVAIRNRWVYR